MRRYPVYACSSTVVWVKDAGMTLVVDRDSQCFWALRDGEAVAWELLALGYSFEKLVTVLSLVLALSVEEAERSLIDMLHRWCDEGLVFQEADGG
jgi:hypothetical protein